MTDDTAGQRAAPLDGNHRTADQAPCGAPQVSRCASHALARFGRPSSYSLSVAELARHVRQLRRGGWQHWEIVTRFDFGRRAA